MAITQAMCSSFKQELLQGLHNFTNGSGGGTTTSTGTGNTYYVALYTDAATMGASTAAYSSSDEATGTAYSAGGQALTNVTPSLDGTTALTDFSDVTWSASTITANGALIYNYSLSGNNAVCVLAFGENKSSSAGDFTIQFPAAAAGSAIIRIA
tara:strand:+ start:1770 stop:2231 length:462 start_codon:yes stop_codon:yes gene_type:complete